MDTKVAKKTVSKTSVKKTVPKKTVPKKTVPKKTVPKKTVVGGIEPHYISTRRSVIEKPDQLGKLRGMHRSLNHLDEEARAIFPSIIQYNINYKEIFNIK